MEAEIHVQVKDNSLSIERILRPISYISWLLGVGIAHPRKCPKAITIIIRIIYMSMCSMSMLFQAKIFSSSSYIFDMYGSTQCISRVIVYVSAYYYIYHGIRQYNKWPELMDKLKELDQEIKKEISINDQSIKIIEALAVFATICCLSMTIVYYCFEDLNFVSYHTDVVLFIMSHYVILAQSLINSFVFVVVVYVLYCRFQTINKLIGQLDKLSDVLALKIRRIRELHTDICDLIDIVNDIHGLHLLFYSMYCFIVTVATLFQFYSSIRPMTYMLLLQEVFPCIVFVTQFYIICWICTLASEESDRTGRIIYEIILKCRPVNLDKHEASNLSSLEVRPPLEDLDDEQSFNQNSSHNLSYADMEDLSRKNLDRECVINEINDFSIQLQQHRIAFTACDFFEISNSLFKGFVGLIITYLLIVDQLDQQSYQDFNRLVRHLWELRKEFRGLLFKLNQTEE